MESMANVGIDIERPTSTMTEVVTLELISPMELVEQVDNMVTTKADPRQASMDDAVNMVTKATPQGSPATMELMEEENTIEKKVVTTPTIKPMEEREQRQEGPNVE